MTQTAINYAKVLYDLKIPGNVIEEAKVLTRDNPELVRVLMSPVVSLHDKERVIDKVFPVQLHNFFKVLSRYQSVDCLEDIYASYEQYVHEKQNILDAVLYYVTPPTGEQLEGIKGKLSKEYGKTSVNIQLIERPELIGGFVIQVGDKETDYSILGRINGMRRQLLRR